MLFAVAAVLLASNVFAVPTNIEKKGVDVVYDIVYKTVEANNYAAPPPADVVYKTVYVEAGHQYGKPSPKPHHKPHHHHHGKPKPKPTTSCTEEAAHPGYTVSVETIVYGAPSPAPAPYHPPAPKYSAPAPAPAQPQYTPPATSYGGGGSLSSQNQAILDAHNSARAAFGAEPLTWDDNLVNHANDASYQCLFQHMSNNNCGENLAEGYSSPAAGVEAWVNEYTQYNYGNPGFGENTGHFTQVVWKSSTTVGCAVQQCSGGQLLRCEYSPPGNYEGEFPQNVGTKVGSYGKL